MRIQLNIHTKLTEPGVVNVGVDLYTGSLRASTSRGDREVAVRHALSAVVVWRDRREEVKNELDLLDGECEC